MNVKEKQTQMSLGMEFKQSVVEVLQYERCNVLETD